MATTTFEQLYPFRSNYLDIDGHRYHYLDEGTGPVVVMLHGNPTWSFYYRNLVLGLRDRFRVIVPDHMGCGLSDKPEDYSYRLATHIRNLTTLIESLGVTRFSMVVHDWGGPIGLGYAVDHPQAIERMVAFNTTPALSTQYPWRILMCKIPGVGPLLIRGCSFFALGATYMAACNRARMTPDVRAGYTRPYDSYRNRIANLRFVQDIPLRPSHPTWATGLEIESKLSVLNDVPKMICWGDRDFCFTEHFLKLWVETFPDTTVHRFKDAGHYVVEDAADDILPLVQAFLQHANDSDRQSRQGA